MENRIIFFSKPHFHAVGEYEGWDKSVIPKWLWMSVEDVVGSSLKALKKDKVVHT